MRREILTLILACGLLAASAPASAQVELSGEWQSILYEDYIERGPGSDLGDFTGMPLNDDARAKALMYTSNLPSLIERQCLHVSPWVMGYRPRGLSIWSVKDDAGKVIAWKIGGDYLRATATIWMDARPHPGPSAQHPSSGFSTGTWEGDTLTVKTTHLKTAWIRRGNGIPGSDQTTFTVHITRIDDLLTITTVQEDPIYLTEPHVVSRVWQLNPRAQPGQNVEEICNTANEVPRLEDSGIVPHYLPGQNPEADFMTRTYNIPREAALGYAETLYPEYRKTLKGHYTPPASCDRYCCGWIETQGRPGGGPNLTCNDGGFGALGPRGRRTAAEATKPETSN
jgi:hypothetical protein